jgi:hypothetical protein
MKVYTSKLERLRDEGSPAFAAALGRADEYTRQVGDARFVTKASV